MGYKQRTNCRICSDASGEMPLTPILNLGTTPLADKFPTSKKVKEEHYPLRVAVCPRCTCVQLMDIVSDDVLFGDDYAFFTGASPSSIPYFENYAGETKKKYPQESQGFVVEIASNDGTLLKHFKESRKILGIEPAKSVAEYANSQGISTLQESFSLNTARLVSVEHGKADMIIGNNVIAHTDRLHDFLAGVNHLLEDNGLAIFEFQYLPHLLFNNAFDHVYHEHRSFFSLFPFQKALSYHGLVVVDAVRADTQGGSLRVFIRKDPWAYASTTKKYLPSKRVADVLEYEKRLGLRDLATYLGFQARVDYLKDTLVSTLRQLKKEGKTIYGFGASAKGNTLLNYCEIGTSLIDCIVDKTPYKIGKYSPGMKIPVVDQVENEPDYYLILVWNYLRGILEREKSYRENGGKFIVPIPNVAVL